MRAGLRRVLVRRRRTRRRRAGAARHERAAPRSPFIRPSNFTLRVLLERPSERPSWESRRALPPTPDQRNRPRIRPSYERRHACQRQQPSRSHARAQPRAERRLGLGAGVERLDDLGRLRADAGGRASAAAHGLPLR